MITRCPQCDAQNRIPSRRLHERATCGRCKARLGPIARPFAVRTEGELDEIVSEAAVPVVVDFWAPWCGPCRAVGPQLEILARRLSGRVLVAKVDTDELPQAASRHRVRSVPTMIVFGHGKEVRRISGAMPADAIASGLQL